MSFQVMMVSLIKQTEQFDRSIGDYFVAVHVGLSARTSLPDDERKFLLEIQFFVQHIVARSTNGISQLGVQLSITSIDQSACFF